MKLNDLPEADREIIRQCASEAGVTEEEFFAAAKKYAKDAVEFFGSCNPVPAYVTEALTGPQFAKSRTKH